MNGFYAGLGVLLAVLTFCAGVIVGIAIAPAPEPLNVDLSACQLVTK